MGRPGGRDLTWAAIYDVSTRMSARYGEQVKATRHHTLRRTTEGIAVQSHGLFEPVRWRSRFSWKWHDHQRVQEAAAAIGERLHMPRSN